VCPGPEQQGLADSSVPELEQDVTVEAATAPGEVLPDALADDGGGGAQVSLRRLSGSGLGAIDDRGSVLRAEIDEADGVAIAARGTLSPGLSAVQLYLGAQEQQLGLSLTPCVSPAESSWLVAGGDPVGRSERLVLVNPGFSAVDVRVEVLGARGASGSRSADASGTVVALEAGEREILLLDALAPGVASPTVQVTASPGPVSAFLGDRWLEGSTDAGMHLTAPVADPATSHVLSSFQSASPEGSQKKASSTGDDESVVVRAAVPGSSAAVVGVRALTPAGPVRLDAGATVVQGRASEDITVGGLPEDSYALEVTSDRPVVAAAQTRSSANAESARDLAWSPALPALGALGGTPLPQPGSGADVDYSLDLSAPRGGTARVVMAHPTGETDSESVDVPRGHSVRRDLGGAAGVWVVPESGRVYASVAAQSRLRPRPADDQVETSAAAERTRTESEPVSLLSVLALPDLTLTRPVLDLAPDVP